MVWAVAIWIYKSGLNTNNRAWILGPEAQANYVADGLHSATCDLSLAPIARRTLDAVRDRVLVRLYYDDDPTPWFAGTHEMSFLTESLGEGTVLEPVVWTVYYWLRQYFDFFRKKWIHCYRFNCPTYNSRIDNFKYVKENGEGVESDLWPFYMAFAKRAFDKHYHFSQPTADYESGQLVSEFIKRGLEEEMLVVLRAIAKEKAERAKQEE